MASTPEQEPVQLQGTVVDIAPDRSMSVRATRPGPPDRVDGYTFGAIPHVEGPGPHGGEVHPDGDELLYVVSGTMQVILDDGDQQTVGTETTVVLRAGDAYVVPRGVWHRVEAVEPSYLVHVTPGPNGGARPRSRRSERVGGGATQLRAGRGPDRQAEGGGGEREGGEEGGEGRGKGGGGGEGGARWGGDRRAAGHRLRRLGHRARTQRRTCCAGDGRASGRCAAPDTSSRREVQALTPTGPKASTGTQTTYTPTGRGRAAELAGVQPARDDGGPRAPPPWRPTSSTTQLSGWGCEGHRRYGHASWRRPPRVANTRRKRAGAHAAAAA